MNSLSLGVILTNPPLQMGETLCARQTSALMLEMTPTTRFSSPRKACTPDTTYTANTTGFCILLLLVVVSALLVAVGKGNAHTVS